MTMTLRQAVSHAASKLGAVPPLAPTASRDAELLLLYALRLPRTTLFSDPGRLLSPREQAAFDTAVNRRLTCEPIQYITGTQEFFGLALRVTPATLIPRPETELLVEAVLDRLPRDRPLRIADVGTGTGAIAIALASHLPEAHITAIDLSPAALAIARENAATHGLTDRIRFLHADLLSTLLNPAPEPHSSVELHPASPYSAAPYSADPYSAVPTSGDPDPNVANPAPVLHPAPTSSPTRFDAVISNPPYVPETDRPTLHPEVRDHEPATALFAGPTGLDIYRRLIPQARCALIDNGLLALEFGHGQSQSLQSLLSGWHELRILEDLAGIPRVALARHPGA